MGGRCRSGREQDGVPASIYMEDLDGGDRTHLREEEGIVNSDCEGEELVDGIGLVVVGIGVDPSPWRLG
jgi:hypothetical protein